MPLWIIISVITVGGYLLTRRLSEGRPFEESTYVDKKGAIWHINEYEDYWAATFDVGGVKGGALVAITSPTKAELIQQVDKYVG